MKILITAFLLSVALRSASAQITLTEQDFLNAYGAVTNQTSFVTTDVSGLASLIALTGANQSWNFGARTWNQVVDTATVVILADPSTAPFASDFPGATHVIKVTPLPSASYQGVLYEFLKVNSSGMWQMGITQDSGGVQSELEKFTPPEQLAAFPLTYGTHWSSSSAITAPFLPPGAVDSLSSTTTVDGYGTVVTPASTSGVQALREKKETISSLGFGMFSLVTRSFSYSWVTANATTSASISADSNQNPISAEYTQGANSAVHSLSGRSEDEQAMYLSQNPVSNSQTKLYYDLKNGGPVTVSLMDALGQSVQVLENGYASAGKNILPIDATSLSRGTYFIRVQTGGASAIQKLVVQ